MAFNSAHNFGIQEPTFNIHQNSLTPWASNAAQILRQAQAVEALHSSVTVGYVSKCHPTTREEVTTDIVDWVLRAAGTDQGSAPRKAMLWLSGLAGGGKTSIMRGVVDRCAATGFSTLSYFFSIRGSGVTTVRPFVATITCQLVALDPVLRPIIYDAIQDRPTVFEESLEEQIEKVLVGPLQSPAFQSQSSPKVVIAIDGLDECREEPEREHLLNALHSLVTRLPPLIVVIASRPELDLRRAFDDPKISNITESIKLHDYDGFNDIRVFVTDELKVIRQSHLLRALIPEGWQPEEIIELLVDKSSGNFIVPVTAMKYIKTSRRNPVDSLNIILGVLKDLSSTSKPFAVLDALYAHILNPPEADPSLIKRILHCIIGVNTVGDTDYISSSFLDDFLRLPPGTTATTLCDLHSVLRIPESKYELIQFHHKSLEDYLLDPERSSDFFQSPHKTQLDLAMLCATHFTRWVSNPVVDVSNHIAYSALYWDDHLKACIDHKPVSSTLPDIIMSLDPRNAMMWRFISGARAYTIKNNLAKALHAALCSKRHCVHLCQLVTRVNNCADECKAFDRTFRGRREEKLDALSRFKSETGLFAPLDPDSRTAFDDEDEDGRLDDEAEADWLSDEDEDGRLGEGDKDDRASITGGPLGSSGGRPSRPPSRRESLNIEAYDITIQPSNDSFPSAVFDDETEDSQADTTGGPASGSGGPAIAGSDRHPEADTTDGRSLLEPTALPPDNSGGLPITVSDGLSHRSDPRFGQQALGSSPLYSNSTLTGPDPLDAHFFSQLCRPDLDRQPLVKRVLHCIIGLAGLINPSPSFLDKFLRLPPTTTATTLDELRSILYIPEKEDESIKFLFDKLKDFLLSERSQDFFQSAYETQLELAKVCSEHIQSWASNPVVDESIWVQHSFYRWKDHVELAIASKPSKDALPYTIVNMDPRTILKYRFVHVLDVWDYDGFRETLHDASCSPQRCVSLCQLLTRIKECWKNIKAFDDALPQYNFEEMLEALPRFESETGLYEPLDPDSRTAFDTEKGGDESESVIDNEDGGDDEDVVDSLESDPDGPRPPSTHSTVRNPSWMIRLVRHFVRRIRRWFGRSPL